MINSKVAKEIDLIYQRKSVLDKFGKEVPLNSEIDSREGQGIIDVLLDNPDFINTMEVGCAMGLSSLYISAVTSTRENSKHTIIDPYQTTHWRSLGLLNLERTGINNYELIEEKSEIALPRLLSEGKSYDFALIDGWHTFDHTLVDFFYLEKMVRSGGIIAIDDVMMPGINKAVRYMLSYPNIELVSIVPFLQKNRMLIRDQYLKLMIKPIQFLLPSKYHTRIFSNKILNSDEELNLFASMVFLRKKYQDDRPWNWFKNF